MFASSYFPKSHYAARYFPPVVVIIGGNILEGMLYLADAGSYTEIELEKVALLHQVFFDENKEHEIYVSKGSTYIRLHIDV